MDELVFILSMLLFAGGWPSRFANLRRSSIDNDIITSNGFSASLKTSLKNGDSTNCSGGRCCSLLCDMKKTCKYCGIVPFDHECPHRKKRHKPSPSGELEKFRSSAKWKRKRELIKERDLYLCQVCRSGQHGAVRYVTSDLEVHHIIPLIEDFERRLDDDNLITLCIKHHKMADAGQLSRRELADLIPPSDL